jgi:carboxylate-amine ligase
VAGLDVVRDRDGEPLVLEDNTRMPSGYSYAVAAREAVVSSLAALAPAVLDAMPEPLPVHEPVGAALRTTMQDAAAAVGGDGCSPDDVVVLTDGPGSAAFFEHRWAADRLGAPLVTVDELERRHREVWRRPRGSRRARQVKAIYRRTESDGLRNGHGVLTPVAQLLLEPWLAGRLAIVNPFGTGVADDKLVHAYVEGMIRFYLGQEPLLRSARTLDLNDSDALAEVLGDLRGYVVKPRHGQGGHGVVVCAHATDPDIRRLEAQLRRPDAGAKCVAQQIVELSTHPTVIGVRLAERHVDLRPFTFATRDQITAVPGGLTRVAWNAGGLVVNSSQEGGAKDTWVLP